MYEEVEPVYKEVSPEYVSRKILNMEMSRQEQIRKIKKSVSDRLKGGDNKQDGGDHYTKMEIQPWDVIVSWPMDQQIGFYRGNVLKYIMRIGSKDATLQEAKKAAHYCKKLVEVLEVTNAKK